jgi:hypothetical protein
MKYVGKQADESAWRGPISSGPTRTIKKALMSHSALCRLGAALAVSGGLMLALESDAFAHGVGDIHPPGVPPHHTYVVGDTIIHPVTGVVHVVAHVSHEAILTEEFILIYPEATAGDYPYITGQVINSPLTDGENFLITRTSTQISTGQIVEIHGCPETDSILGSFAHFRHSVTFSPSKTLAQTPPHNSLHSHREAIRGDLSP